MSDECPHNESGDDLLLAAIFKDFDPTRENPPVTGHYANYARKSEPRSAAGWTVNSDEFFRTVKLTDFSPATRNKFTVTPLDVES